MAHPERARDQRDQRRQTEADTRPTDRHRREQREQNGHDADQEHRRSRIIETVRQRDARRRGGHREERRARFGGRYEVIIRIAEAGRRAVERANKRRVAVDGDGPLLDDTLRGREGRTRRATGEAGMHNAEKAERDKAVHTTRRTSVFRNANLPPLMTRLPQHFVDHPHRRAAGGDEAAPDRDTTRSGPARYW